MPKRRASCPFCLISLASLLVLWCLNASSAPTSIVSQLTYYPYPSNSEFGLITTPLAIPARDNEFVIDQSSWCQVELFESQNLNLLKAYLKRLKYATEPYRTDYGWSKTITRRIPTIRPFQDSFTIDLLSDKLGITEKKYALTSINERNYLVKQSFALKLAKDFYLYGSEHHGKIVTLCMAYTADPMMELRWVVLTKIYDLQQVIMVDWIRQVLVKSTPHMPLEIYRP